MALVAQRNTNLFDLPQDVLDLIFPYLPPKSFLILCSVSKGFYERYHLDSLYWRMKTSNTFRFVCAVAWGYWDYLCHNIKQADVLSYSD